MHAKIVQTSCNRIVAVDNMDIIIDGPARMCNPLPAYHELIVSVVAKRVCHASMPTSYAHTALDGIEQSLFLLLRNCSHCPDGHNQVECLHLGIILVHVQARS